MLINVFFYDEFLPLTIKEEPLDYSYDGNLTVTNLSDEGIKIEIKNEPVEESDVIGNGSPTLEKSPESEQEVVKPRRTSRKSTNTLVTQNADALLQKTQIIKRSYGLNEISRMNVKELVQNFAEMESNEMTKYYCFTCCLMPDICSNFFTSFGSENDAKARMQRHLQKHIKELLAEKEKDKSFLFMADTILLLAADEEVPEVTKTGRGRRRKQVTKSVGKPTRVISEVEPADSKLELDVIDLNDIKLENLNPDDQVATEEMLNTPTVKSTQKRKKKADDDEWIIQKRQKTKKDKIVLEISNHLPGKFYITETPDNEEAYAVRHECKPKSPWCHDHTYDVYHFNPLEGMIIKGLDLNEDLQYCQTQTPPIKTQEIADIADSELTRLLFTLTPEDIINPSKLVIPILTVSSSHLPRNLNCLPNNPLEECDDIDLPLLRVSKYGTRDAVNPIIPRGKPEHEVYRDMDFAIDITEEEIRAIEALKGNWTGEHIKILSKYYLRELEMNKGRNKKKKALCGCKICPNKKFTAVTTLYYHYISHTGEKPFKCSKCDKGFTRRHSLNYHAMTHSNTNRFKCPICLKQFRHTSHYKDHVKHHTGEEECHCRMCNTTFKSRTAFNRHLKTKHNLRITGSNKVSRVMSPGRINQLHLREIAGEEESEILNIEEFMGLGSSKVRKEIKSEDVPSLMVIKKEPGLVERVEIDSMIETSPRVAANIQLEAEDLSIQNVVAKRRKPRILKPRLSMNPKSKVPSGSPK